ncbi:MAG: EFR1 family ferrodoxin, partial [Methanoregula sp.]
HSFTGNLPAAGKRISSATRETLPVPVASPRAGRGGSVRTVPVCDRFSFTGFEHALLHGRSIARAREEDRIFCVTTACTSCGTCEAVCPVKNIIIAGKKPAWKRHCELCLACIRTCPAQAIRIRGTYELADGTATRY